MVPVLFYNHCCTCSFVSYKPFILHLEVRLMFTLPMSMHLKFHCCRFYEKSAKLLSDEITKINFKFFWFGLR